MTTHSTISTGFIPGWALLAWVHVVATIRTFVRSCCKLGIKDFFGLVHQIFSHYTFLNTTPCTTSRKVSFLPPPSPSLLITVENVGKHSTVMMDEVIEVAGFSFPLHIFPLNLQLTASENASKHPLNSCSPQPHQDRVPQRQVTIVIKQSPFTLLEKFHPVFENLSFNGRFSHLIKSKFETKLAMVFAYHFVRKDLRVLQ